MTHIVSYSFPDNLYVINTNQRIFLADVPSVTALQCAFAGLTQQIKSAVPYVNTERNLSLNK